jgi:hypothetical protein
MRRPAVSPPADAAAGPTSGPAAECRFLQLLAEFDRRDGWAGDGVRSCVQRSAR